VKQQRESFFLQIADIQGSVEITTHFGAGRFRDRQKLMKLIPIPTFEALGDI